MMSSDPTLSGEARLKARRSAFWRYLAFAFAACFAVGTATGNAARLVKDGVLPAGLLVAVWLVAVIGFAWGSRDYFRRIDEVDLLDNLWASTIGFYVYIVTLGSWFVFHDIGLVPKPQHITIAAIATTAMLVAYGARRLGMR